MKKFLSFLLIFVLTLTLIVPVTTEASTIKLNKTKITLNVDETYNLKLAGVSERVKWSSSDKNVVKVSLTGKVTGLNVGDADVTATSGSKKYKCNVTVRYDTELMLYNTYNWTVGLWNDSFYDFAYYINYGTDQYGTSMDIQGKLAIADQYMAEYDKYDKFVKSLSDDDYYSELTGLWEKITEQVDYIYKRLKNNISVSSDVTYQEYSPDDFNKLYDYICELNNIIN